MRVYKFEDGEVLGPAGETVSINLDCVTQVWEKQRLIFLSSQHTFTVSEKGLERFLRVWK